jgi:hypothetical protein
VVRFGRSALLVVLAWTIQAAGASPAAAFDGWSFGGSTSQRFGSSPYPFMFDDLLGRARVAMEVPCEGGGAFRRVYNIDVPLLPESGPAVYVLPQPDGRRVVLELWFSRERSGSTLRGRVRARERHMEGEDVVLSCDSGFVRYAARDSVFAGDTDPLAAGDPRAVSARLADGGRRLRSFLISWETRQCPLATGGRGFLAAPTRVPSVPVDRRGRFSARGDYQATTSSGNTLIVRYSLRGGVSKLRAGSRQRDLLGGVFRVRADLREADGGYRIRNCPTPRIFFEAVR